MSKSLNQSSNSLFRTEQKSAKVPLNLRNKIHIPRFFRANFITDILDHPENQFPRPGPASQKTNNSDPTHQNIFPILRCQVFIRRLGCREITGSVFRYQDKASAPEHSICPLADSKEQDKAYRQHHQRHSVARETSQLYSLQQRSVTTGYGVREKNRGSRAARLDSVYGKSIATGCLWYSIWIKDRRVSISSSKL